MTDFNLDTVPLAIVRRLADLDGQAKKLDEANQRDTDQITELREQINKIKARIDAREPDLGDILNQREALAFAVKAYQDETPVKEKVETWGSAGLAVAPPTAPVVVEAAPPPLKERVYEAVRSAGYPIKGGELARSLGLSHPASVSTVLALLSSEHRIRRAEEGGWLAIGQK